MSTRGGGGGIPPPPPLYRSLLTAKAAGVDAKNNFSGAQKLNRIIVQHKAS